MANLDVTKTGPVGLKGLKGLGQPTTDSSFISNFIRMGRSNPNSVTQMYSPSGETNVGQQLVDYGYGASKYDDDITRLSQVEDINEFRAQDQPWYDQIANGAMKMLTTAGTTFLDGTLGTLWGIGQGIVNLIDDDPDTGFWRGMWDNGFSNAMADTQEKMENTFKNYRTEWEQNAAWYDRIFSSSGAANFWGDDILKNAGFTLGAAGAIWATAGAGVALKGTGGLSKLGKAIGLAREGVEGLEATGFGKVAGWLAKTFVSTQGEASIEALNATRDNKKLMEQNLENRDKEARQVLLDEYEQNIANGMTEGEAKSIYSKKYNQLTEDNKLYKEQMERELTDAGNMIYAANIAALSLSNNLTLGSMIRGGYGNSKSLLEQATRMSKGKAIEGTKATGKALLDDALQFEAPQVEHRTAKALGHWLLTSTQEGIEEGVQNLVSSTGQIAAQARMNKYASELKHKDNSTSMLGTMINPDTPEDFVDYTKALHKAMEDTFGAANSQGWTEVAVGFISGALGVGSIHRNSEGNIRPTWQGGLKESWNTVNGNREAVKKQTDLLNSALSSNKFGERARHAVQQMAIKKAQDTALQRGDTRAFKNYEVQQLVNDAVFFRNVGMLDDYLQMYKEMSEGITDADVNELKTLAKGEQGQASSLEGMTNDQIKTIYQDKAKSSLEKIQQGLKSYEDIEKKYAEKFSEGTRQEAIMELSFYDTLLHDTSRRTEEIQKEIDDLEKREHLTPMEETQVKQKKQAIESLKKQQEQLEKQWNEYTKNPKTLQNNITKRQVERQKVALYKQADKAIESYKKANTLKDIVDIYSHSPEDDREQVLTQAIEKAEGDTKTKLQQFKNYMGDVNTLEKVIEEKFPLDNEETAMLNYQYRQAFNNMLNEAVNEMLDDESNPIDRATLKQKFVAKLNEYSTKTAEAKAKAGSLRMSKEGTSYDFGPAIDNKEVTDEDFVEDVDDDLNVTTTVKEDSRADEMIKSFEDARGLQRIVDNLQYLVNSLDKLDELREAGKKTEKKSAPKKSEKKPTEKKKKSSKGTFTEEVLDVDDDVEMDDDEDGGSWDDMDDEDNDVPESIKKQNLARAARILDDPDASEEDKKKAKALIEAAAEEELSNPKEATIAKKLLQVKDKGELEKLGKEISKVKDDKEAVKRLENIFQMMEDVLYNDNLDKHKDTIDGLLKQYDKTEKAAARKAKNKDEEDKEPVTPNLLSKDEAANYKQVEKKGTSGVTYHTIKKTNTKAAKSSTLSHKLEYTDKSIATQEINLEHAKNDDEKRAILNKMQDIVSKNLIGNKTLQRLEKIFSDNAALMKPSSAKRAALRTHNNKEGQSLADSDTSLNANQFAGFVKSELNSKGKMVPVTTQKNGSTPIQKLLEDKGFNIQHTIDTYLGKVVERDSKKKTDKKTPIHYLHSNEFQNVVFLGMKYSDVQDVMPRDQVDIVSTNDGDYVVVGTLGWESSREGTQEQFNTILDILHSEHTGDGWYASTQTNRVKDMTAGAVVKQAPGDTMDRVRDLAEMLTPNNFRNPFNLTIDDIKWMIVEGTEEKPKPITIPDESFPSFGVNGARPGQVYMYIPSANGTYIPVYMEPIFYMELELTTPLNMTIERLIKNLASQDVTMEDRKRAITNLKNLLVFSKPNDIHLNEEDNKFDPNTLYITRNGEAIKVIDYSEGTGTWEDLYELLKQINPRVNLSIPVLTSNPSIYLRSKVLKTDVAMLGTANSSFFVYPVNSEGEYVENKSHKAALTDTTGAVKTRVYLNGQYIYYDGNKFTDAGGNEVEDEDGLLKVAYEIKQNKYKPIKVNKGTYYDVNGTMYSDNGHGGLMIIDDELRAKVLKASSKAKDKKARKKRVKKKEDEGPEVEEQSAEVKKLEDDLRKAAKLAKTAMETTNDISELQGLIAQLEEAINAAEGTKVNKSVLQTSKTILSGIKVKLNNNIRAAEEAARKNLNKNEPTSIDKRIIIDSSLGTGMTQVYGYDPNKNAKDARATEFWRKRKSDSRSVKNPKTGNLRENFYVEFPDGTSMITYFSNKNERTIGRHDGMGITIWRKLTPEEVKAIQDYLWEGDFKSYTEVANFVDKVMHSSNDKKQSQSGTNNNFTNGTQLDSLKSQKELEESKKSSTFAAVINKRANSAKTDQLYDLVSEKFGIDADNDNELLAALQQHNIDLSSNDIDTVLDILKNCR